MSRRSEFLAALAFLLTACQPAVPSQKLASASNISQFEKKALAGDSDALIATIGFHCSSASTKEACNSWLQRGVQEREPSALLFQATRSLNESKKVATVSEQRTLLLDALKHATEAVRQDDAAGSQNLVNSLVYEIEMLDHSKREDANPEKR